MPEKSRNEQYLLVFSTMAEAFFAAQIAIFGLFQTRVYCSDLFWDSLLDCTVIKSKSRPRYVAFGNDWHGSVY